MTDRTTSASFERVAQISANSPTLIEGLLAHGLVAAIAVDRITNQLELDHYGTISSEVFPPVTRFENGLVQDLVRVCVGPDPAVMTPESDLALPHQSFIPLPGACSRNSPTSSAARYFSPERRPRPPLFRSTDTNRRLRTAYP